MFPSSVRAWAWSFEPNFRQFNRKIHYFSKTEGLSWLIWSQKISFIDMGCFTCQNFSRSVSWPRQERVTCYPELMTSGLSLCFTESLLSAGWLWPFCLCLPINSEFLLSNLATYSAQAFTSSSGWVFLSVFFFLLKPCSFSGPGPIHLFAAA